MKRLVSTAVLALVITTNAHAEPVASSVESGAVMKAIQDELARAPTMQLNGMAKPYYAALEVTDQEWITVNASLGKIVNDEHDRARRLKSRIRVGDYANDSSAVEDESWRHREGSPRRTTIDDRYDDVRHEAWLSLDDSYKGALDALAKKAAIRAGQSASPDRVDDFSREPPTVLVDARPAPALDFEKSVRLARALSAVGITFPALQGSSASVSSARERSYFVSSEGARVVQPRFAAMVQTVFRAQADDGMPLMTYRSTATCSGETMPPDAVLLADARQAATELDEIRRAPLVDDYSGPVLFESVAAPQVIYDFMGYSLSGTPPPVSSNERSYRRRPESELAGRVGERVMPAGFRLEDDPTIDRLASLPLAGCYKVDEEGVPAQKVTLVDDGVFKAFLMSRTPRKGFLRSNGHGRSTADGLEGAIANLALTSSKGLAPKDLRQRLIAEAKAQKKPFAIIIERLAERYVYDLDATRADMAGRGRGNGTDVLVMWKLGLDGKATRVRGGQLGVVEMRAFKDILAAGSVPAVHGYNGPSGFSVTAPALLFKDLEVKKLRDPTKRPPVLPRPE